MNTKAMAISLLTIGSLFLGGAPTAAAACNDTDEYVGAFDKRWATATPSYPGALAPCQYGSTDVLVSTNDDGLSQPLIILRAYSGGVNEVEQGQSRGCGATSLALDASYYSAPITHVRVTIVPSYVDETTGHVCQATQGDVILSWA